MTEMHPEGNQLTGVSPRRAAFICLVAAVLALGSFMLSGCAGSDGASNAAQGATAPSGQEGSAYVFTDDLGNEVTVKSHDRVIACMGSFARTWELAGGTLIGVTDDAISDYGIASSDVVTVGDFSSPNLEQIIAAEPDFVIMTASSAGRGGSVSQADLKETLEASGITVAYFSVTTFEDYLRMLRTCCDITGRDDLYAANGDQVAQEIEGIVADVPQGSAPTALLMTTYSGGTRVQDSSSMTGDMLADLGVVNLADVNTSLLKDFSLEAIIELDPDYIFILPAGNDEEAAKANLLAATEANPAWSTLSAVSDGNVVILDDAHFLYKPNDTWAESYRILSDALYA